MWRAASVKFAHLGRLNSSLRQVNPWLMLLLLSSSLWWWCSTMQNTTGAHEDRGVGKALRGLFTIIRCEHKTTQRKYANLFETNYLFWNKAKGSRCEGALTLSRGAMRYERRSAQQVVRSGPRCLHGLDVSPLQRTLFKRRAARETCRAGTGSWDTGQINAGIMTPLISEDRNIQFNSSFRRDKRLHWD